jgi:hypothetical protein
MKKNSPLLALEIIWIATGVICIIAGIRLAVSGEGMKILIFAFMAFVCFVFAWLRHLQRKKG